MAGGIYSDQRCPLCGGRFGDDGRRGLVCSNHPSQRATAFKVKFCGITRRFSDYQTAQAFLGGLRAQKGGLSSHPFDPRDYQIKEKPLSFQVLSEKWLEVKRQTVKPRSFSNLKNYMDRASSCWGDANVKHLGYAEIEDFLLAQKDISSKTRANLRAGLNNFWTWLEKRKVITPAERPEFPDCAFELGWRKIVDKETQATILAEVERIAPERVWLGIKWLCDYPAIRPGELLRLKEGDILRDQGVFVFPDPKEKKPKLVPLLEDDLPFLRALPLTHPATPFFRHFAKGKNHLAGAPYGKDYLYVWWKRACKNLGIEGVDLYGGTRHSSAVAARSFLTYEETKTLTGHSTNTAFERYFHRDLEYVRQIQAKLPGKVVLLSGSKQGQGQK
jgi:integrase